MNHEGNPSIGKEKITHRGEIPCGRIESDYKFSHYLGPDEGLAFKSQGGILILEVKDRRIEEMFTSQRPIDRFLRSKDYRLGQGIKPHWGFGEILYRIEGVNEKTSVKIVGNLWLTVPGRSVPIPDRGIFQSEEDYFKGVFKESRELQDKWYNEDKAVRELVVKMLQSQSPKLLEGFRNDLAEMGFSITKDDYQGSEREYRQPYIIHLADGTEIVVKVLDHYAVEFDVERSLTQPVNVSEIKDSLGVVGKVVSAAFWSVENLAWFSAR